MILGNYSVLNKNSGKSTARLNSRYQFSRVSPFMNLFTSEANAGRIPNASLPTGTQPPYSFVLAIKGGELSSTTSISGTGALTGAMSMGKAMTADLAGVGALIGSMSLVSSMSATLSGAGTLSGSVTVTLSLIAALAGSGSLSGSLSLLIPLIASLNGVGALTGNMKGNADLEAHIFVNTGSAEVQQIVDGVWNALAADYNVSGTMGQKLNGAGSAGDPWTTDLSGYNTANTAGKILKETKSKAALAATLSA